MDRRMHCRIPNESYNINHNIRYCRFKYAWHVHDLVYEGILIHWNLDLIPFFSYKFLNISISENINAYQNTVFCSELHDLQDDRSSLISLINLYS